MKMSFPLAPLSPETKSTKVQENKVAKTDGTIPLPTDDSARTDAETATPPPSPPPPAEIMCTKNYTPQPYEVMPPNPPHSSPTLPYDPTLYVETPPPFSPTHAHNSYSPARYYDHCGGYYPPHPQEYAYAHMYPHPEGSYYHCSQWQVPPQAYYQGLSTGGPCDMPALHFPIPNTHPIQFPQPLPSYHVVGHHSSSAATAGNSHKHPSMSSFGTRTSFDRSASAGSGFSLDSAHLDPISTSRHHRDGSGGSGQSKHLRGSFNASAGNKKRGLVKQKRSGSGDASAKSGSSSSAVTFTLGIRLDENATLLQIKGHIVRIAKDQDGSRFIQQRLDYLADPAHNVASSSNEELNLVFSEAMSSIEDLWNDVYGNFILQKLLDHGTEDMKDELGDRFYADVVSLSNRVYGCRVVQKAFDTLPKKKVAKLVSAFEGRVLPCIHDHNGNHVIQKSITVISTFAKEAREEEGCEELVSFFLESLDPIINEVIHDMEGLSRHPYGCRVVQRMVEHCIEPQKSRVLDSIIIHHNVLVDDQYGNYVVQRSLAYGREQDRKAVFETVSEADNVVRLSMRKQASNVVEMMIKHGNERQRQKLVQEMLDNTCIDQSGNTQSAIIAMSMDSYANYVVKTAMDVVDSSPQRDQLFGVLISHLRELEEIPFAKHIVSRIHSHLGEATKAE